MPNDEDSTFVPMTNDDIAALATRLSEWSESLPAAERSLAQLLVEHARELRPEDVVGKQLVTEISKAAESVVKSINERWRGASEGWVEIGPIWEKKNQVEFGEEIEIVQRLFARGQQQR